MDLCYRNASGPVLHPPGLPALDAEHEADGHPGNGPAGPEPGVLVCPGAAAAHDLPARVSLPPRLRQLAPARPARGSRVLVFDRALRRDDRRADAAVAERRE